MNSRERTRQTRMQKMGERVLEQGVTVNYQKEVAWAMLNFGVSRRTAKEYVDPIILLHGD